MNRNIFASLLLALLLAVALCGCRAENTAAILDASKFGVSAGNDGKQNSENLQKLIDRLSETGGTVYIPAGEYEFAENGTQTIGSHCIKMKSNIRIVGDGSETVLKPVGASAYGLDMFYHNDYLDLGQPIYLENCVFEDFVIDAAGTSCETYTSAGKGFMFNLFRNCHWKNVSVFNTDATGFGVDCPLSSSITNCTAINCGKAATVQNGGASGFGIGYGYTASESISITNCTAVGNRKFGFFFEHQGRFDETRYAAQTNGIFAVECCTAQENLFNFGGICAENVVFKKCISADALQYGFYFENSANCTAAECTSEDDREAAFAAAQPKRLENFQAMSAIAFNRCSANHAKYGVILTNEVADFAVSGVEVRNCTFSDISGNTIYTSGAVTG